MLHYNFLRNKTAVNQFIKIYLTNLYKLESSYVKKNEQNLNIGFTKNLIIISKWKSMPTGYFYKNEH